MRIVFLTLMIVVMFSVNLSMALASQYRHWPAIQAALTGDVLEQTCAAEGYTDLADCLINRYAPQLRFHSQEVNFPAPVWWYLERVHLRYSQNNCSDGNNVLDVGEVTPIALGQQKREVRSRELMGCNGTGRIMPSDRVASGNHGFFLQVPNAAVPETWIRREEQHPYQGIIPINDSRAAIYAHFARRLSRTTNEFLGFEIQYWIFFPRDGGVRSVTERTEPYVDIDQSGTARLAKFAVDTIWDIRGNGAHEGDWELFKAHVNVDGILTDVFFKQHGKTPQRFHRCSITLTLDDGSKDTTCMAMASNAEDFTHPVVYVALGKHAFFPTAGRHPGATAATFDHTNDGPVKWNTIGSVRRLGDRFNPRPGMEWIQYAGKWGEYGEIDLVGGSSSGPTGPAMKGQYCESGNKDVGTIEKLDACELACPSNVTREQAWVAFYDKKHFSGPVELHRGASQQDAQDFSDLRLLNYENQISSLKACVPEGNTYEVYAGRNYTGDCLRVEGGAMEKKELSQTLAGNMDNKISSGRFVSDGTSECRPISFGKN